MDHEPSDKAIQEKLQQAQLELVEDNNVKVYKLLGEALDELLSREESHMDVDVSTFFDRRKIERVITECEEGADHDNTMKLIIGYAND